MNKLIYIFTILFISINISYAQDKYKITADKLNIRESNDAKSKIIGYIKQDEIVEIIDNSDSKYVKIKVSNGEGWISREYIAIINKAEASPKIIDSTNIDSNKIDYLNISNKASKTTTNPNSSQWIFLGLVFLVTILLTVIIFKYIKSRAYQIISLLVIILFSYSIYQGFLRKRIVEGKYNSLANHQFSTFEFKSNGKVLIYDQLLDTTYVSDYTIDGSKLRFKQDENLFILIIKDDNTLLGEGFLKGQYIK